jgi:hypothetical protein
MTIRVPFGYRFPDEIEKRLSPGSIINSDLMLQQCGVSGGGGMAEFAKACAEIDQ